MKRSSILNAGLALAAVVGILGCGESSEVPIEPTGPTFSLLESRPFVCPTTATRFASVVVHPRGGTLELDGHTVAVPAGAVRHPTEIALTVPASRYLEIELRANGSEHFQFNKPLTIRISYARCARRDIDQHNLSAWQIDPSTKAFMQRMPSRDLKIARAVVFTSDHFSNFALAD